MVQDVHAEATATWANWSDSPAPEGSGLAGEVVQQLWAQEQHRPESYASCRVFRFV